MTSKKSIGAQPGQAEQAANLDLWERHRRVNEDFTKNVSYGKRNFTAVDPQYLIELATREWGPYGFGWSCDVVDVQVVNPAPDKSDASIFMTCTFTYPNGNFNIVVDDKYRAGQDMLKKLQTNAMSKALSKLGFAADIYLGKFEDEAYRQSSNDEDSHFVTRMMGKIANSTPEELETRIGIIKQWANKGTITVEQMETLLNATTERQAELA